MANTGNGDGGKTRVPRIFVDRLDSAFQVVGNVYALFTTKDVVTGSVPAEYIDVPAVSLVMPFEAAEQLVVELGRFLAQQKAQAIAAQTTPRTRQ